jgi:hypothetical protein
MKSVKQISKLGCLIAVCVSLLAACSEPQYPTPPFTQVLDLTTVGVIYEQNFTVPTNREWAPGRLEFGQSHSNYEIQLEFRDLIYEKQKEDSGYNAAIRQAGTFEDTVTALRKFEKIINEIEGISNKRLNELLGDEARYPEGMTEQQWRSSAPVMKKKGAPIQLKLTLTPLGGPNKSIDYLDGPYMYRNSGWWKTAAPSKPIEITLDLSTYRTSGSRAYSGEKKLLAYFRPLQIDSSYHLRVENLNPLQLPLGIQTTLLFEFTRPHK